MRVAGGLTYTYSLDAVQSYLIAWQHAGHLNRTVRLSDARPGRDTARAGGQEIGLVCNVDTEQSRSVTSSTDTDDRRFIAVTVGAVTVHAYTTTALESYLGAWREAATVTAVLEAARPGI